MSAHDHWNAHHRARFQCPTIVFYHYLEINFLRLNITQNLA